MAVIVKYSRYENIYFSFLLTHTLCFLDKNSLRRKERLDYVAWGVRARLELSNITNQITRLVGPMFTASLVLKKKGEDV